MFRVNELAEEDGPTTMNTGAAQRELSGLFLKKRRKRKRSQEHEVGTRLGKEEWIWRRRGGEGKGGRIGSKHIYRYDILEGNKTILKTEFSEYTEACSNSHNCFIVKSNYYENSSLNSRNSVSLAVPLIRS